jgi:hypothetical protein
MAKRLTQVNSRAKDGLLRALSRQGLDRRISAKPTLTEDVAAWEDSRNKKHAKADWHSTTAGARLLMRMTPQCERLGLQPCSGVDRGAPTTAPVQRLHSPVVGSVN